MKIIIPARKGSKGVPYKNRILLKETLDTIPENLKEDTIVSTDDEYIIDESKKYGIKSVKRGKDLASDRSSMKSVLLNLIKDENITCEQTIIMLYLTYPERTWKEIEDVISFFNKNKAKSVLCRKEVKAHPYLCMFEDESGLHGSQILEHDLYRRQDYPKCFEISHYVCIMKASEVENLNKNLYNEKTFFYQIEDRMDIDLKKDLELYSDKYNS